MKKESKAPDESKSELISAISQKCPDLPPGAVKQLANELSGCLTGNAVAQYQDRQKIAEQWNIKFELLDEIDREFKDQYKNVRKAMSQRLMAVAAAGNETLMMQLNNPEVVARMKPEELAKTIKYLTDASVTLDDGHKPQNTGADLTTLAGIRALLGNPQFMDEMKKVNGKVVTK